MLSAIVSIDANNGIGLNGKLLCPLSDDLKRFKKITSGKKIIMGRKTFDSLPHILPNRTHIVITRNENLIIQDTSVIISNDLNSLIEEYKNSEEEVFLIGGEDIFKEALSHCKKIYLTKINASFDADKFLPYFDKDEYITSFESDFILDEKTKVKFQYIDYILKYNFK
jgi:dihydrofolate reductase